MFGFEILTGLLLDQAKGVAGEWVKGKAKDLFTDPPVVEAYEAACKKVAAEYPELFSEYTGSAVNKVPNEAASVSVVDKVVRDWFDQLGFPSLDELTEVLVDGWRKRKAALVGQEAASFFVIPEEEAKPVLRGLARLFFAALTQVPKFRDPFSVQSLILIREYFESRPKQDSKEDVESEIGLYRDWFQEKVLPSLSQTGEDRFQLTCRSPQANSPQIPLGTLFQEIVRHRQILLTGKAGSGKSVALAQVAGQLAASGASYLPVYLDISALGNGFAEIERLGSSPNKQQERWDILVYALRPPLQPNTLDRLAQYAIPFLIADKLNEAPGPQVADMILQTFFGYARARSPKPTCILMAGRVVPGGVATDWTVLTIDSMTESTVRQHIDGHFGPGEYDKLPRTDRDLLCTPYYLNLALQSPSPNLGTAAAAIETYFKEYAKLNDADLDAASIAAFDAYKRAGSTLFSTQEFTALAGEFVWERLRGAGIAKMADQGLASLDHQLYHDYLAARYCVSRRLWDIQALDTISLRANSFEAIHMILEQLGDPLSGDDFLRSVYDWNLSAAVSSIRESEMLEKKPFTPQLETALLAMMSEKMFDHVQPTRDKAVALFQDLGSPAAKAILKAGSALDQVFEVVNDVPAAEPWFADWRALFTRKGSVGEAEIDRINSTDSVVGWTAANVARRSQAEGVERDPRGPNGETLARPEIDPAGQVQLRAIYRSHAVDSQKSRDCGVSDTIRWRVVHVLGVFPSGANCDLLIDALHKDTYLWARYGAARSLVEMAAITAGSVRTRIIETLSNRAAELSKGGLDSRRILDEIGRTVFYRYAAPGWKEAVEPLLRKIVDSQKTGAFVQQWGERLKQFLDWDPESPQNLK